MTPVKRGASTEAGWTLVEVVVAFAILSLAALATTTVIFLGDRVSKQQVSRADQVQTLRSAIKQMADDLAYAQYDNTCGYRPEYGITSFRVGGYVPPVQTDPDVWPGNWQNNWNRVCVFYVIEGDALIRETYHPNNGKVFARRAVMTGLATGSEIQIVLTTSPAQTATINVTLKVEKEGEPGEYTEVSTQFFVS